MKPALYVFSVLALWAGALATFRILVRRDYRRRGRLTLLSSLLELIIWLAYIVVPYLYNPPCWPYVWSCDPDSPRVVALIGYFLIGAGALLGFGAMFWLGLRRSFGRHVTALFESGPYAFSRNPQIVGGSMMVAGVALLWPSWYAAGWILLWIAMFHPMVLTEEEHLRRVHGEAYTRYCERVPRYISLPVRR